MFEVNVPRSETGNTMNVALDLGVAPLIVVTAGSNLTRKISQAVEVVSRGHLLARK